MFLSSLLIGLSTATGYLHNFDVNSWVANKGSSTADYPNVKLEVYMEALCPSCQELTTGSLSQVLAMDDIAAITDFKIVPYVI